VVSGELFSLVHGDKDSLRKQLLPPDDVQPNAVFLQQIAVFSQSVKPKGS